MTSGFALPRRRSAASADAQIAVPVFTPDRRYIIVRGRLWRAANPELSVKTKHALTQELMSARRAVAAASRSGSPAGLEAARARVHAAKVALGERGPVWWSDGSPDYNRFLVKNSPYASWAASREARMRASRRKSMPKKKRLEDWRGKTLARVRDLIMQAAPGITEELKWKKPSNPAGVPVWSHSGIICTGEIYKDKVKLTFAKGAALKDPRRLFNSSLEGNTRRAIDIREGDPIDEKAFKALVREAASLNNRS